MFLMVGGHRPIPVTHRGHLEFAPDGKYGRKYDINFVVTHLQEQRSGEGSEKVILHVNQIPSPRVRACRSGWGATSNRQPISCGCPARAFTGVFCRHGGQVYHSPNKARVRRAWPTDVLITVKLPVLFHQMCQQNDNQITSRASWLYCCRRHSR